MGTFYQRVGVGNPASNEFQWVDALIDTVATHSMLPASLLTHTLHLSPKEELVFTLADGSKQAYNWGEARFKIGELEMTTPVIYGPEGRYLIGATTLQNFNLIADTTHHRLLPTPELTL